MRFRPCIDLHGGAVKQIVGATLSADPGSLHTNFAADLPSSHYADLYRRDGLDGGHVIMLGPGNEEAATEALAAFPDGLQIGGGMTPHSAVPWLDRGASGNARQPGGISTSRVARGHPASERSARRPWARGGPRGS